MRDVCVGYVNMKTLYVCCSSICRLVVDIMLTHVCPEASVL